MKDYIFPIGFWDVNLATKHGVEGVKNLEDIGATVTMSGFYDSARCDKAEMLAILDECERKNIKIIFNDRSIIYKNFCNENYEETLKQRISDFGSHPAIYAFKLGDEPTEEYMEDAINTVKLFKKLCPHKEAFLNLLPWWPKLNDDGVLIAATGDNYRDKVLNFVKQTGVNILSYDCYMQMCEKRKGELDPLAYEAYYRNLNIFSSVAKETGSTFWYTTLAVGHGMYKCPDQDCFRWEINTAVAHGVKGLLYWYLYADHYNFNYRLHPIDMLNQRTDTFRYVSTENRIFQEVYGAVFCKLVLEKAYHAIEAFGGFPLIEQAENEIIKSVETNVGTPMIISKFSNPDEPDFVYYATVNNSQTETIRANIYYDTECVSEVYEVRSNGTGPQHIGSGFIDKKNGKCTYYYSPGQMWVFAFKKKKKYTNKQ